MNNPLISPGIGVFVWMLVAFGILVFVLAKFGWPVITRTLNEREKAINEALRAAETAKEEMKQLEAHNEELLRQARMERDEMLRHARQTGEQIIEDARTKAVAEADRIVANARENINYEKLKAMTDLKNDVAQLSISIAEKLMQAELSDRDRANELVRRELEETVLQS